MIPYRDRHAAGVELASHLRAYSGRNDLIVLALPRGGVPVAFPVAQSLHAPLDIFLVRKLGVPGHEELAMGAIASSGGRVLNEEVIQALRIPRQVVDSVTDQESAELSRREAAYRDGRPAPDVQDRVVILVDDGLATGSSMKAAVQAVRSQHPFRVVVAVPVAAAQTCEALCQIADEVVCARTPEPFFAVGLSYEDFSQTTDEEVRSLLQLASSVGITPTASSPTPSQSSLESVEERQEGV